jgi:hypothetical protein
MFTQTVYETTAPGIVALLLAAAVPFGAYAAESTQGSAPIQSVWQPQEIKYSYVGFTTAYNCDAFESKLKSVLKTLGAHPETKVRASGCDLNRPSRNFFVTVTTATPVPASEEAINRIKSSGYSESQQKLLERLGTKKPVSSDQFPAQWQTVDLAQNRRLDLQPGDCELMEGLRDHVLPKLDIKVVENKVQCTPKQLSIQTPQLKVSALVALPSADKPTT